MSFKLGPSTVVNPSGKLLVDSSKWLTTFTNSNRPTTDASVGDVIYNSEVKNLQVWNGYNWINIRDSGSDLFNYSSEYFIGDNAQQNITVPTTCNVIKIAGAGRGSSGPSAAADANGSFGGYPGGGGGGSNITGYTVNGIPFRGTTLRVETNSDAVVYAGPSASPKLFQADAGNGITGGSVSVGDGIAGGDGGVGGARYNQGFPGKTSGTGGGGGAGGIGDNSPYTIGQPGGAGGSSIVLAGAISPLGVGPAPEWSIGIQTGGAGGIQGGSGQSYPTGAAGGTSGGLGWHAGGGGAGGGIVINGVAYGGGGGGGPSYPPGASGIGGGAFAIIQFIGYGNGAVDISEYTENVGFSGSGGNVNGLEPGNGYVYHTFTSPGSFTVSAGEGTAEILLVGGGGGGGPSNDSNSGGGGAGGLIYWNSMPITPGTYPVTIGNGGAAGQNNGQDSVFDPGNPLHLVALGGGYAGGGPRQASYAGANGGSGGGGSGFESDTAGGSGIQTTSAPLPANSKTYGFGTDGSGAKYTNPSTRQATATQITSNPACSTYPNNGWYTRTGWNVSDGDSNVRQLVIKWGGSVIYNGSYSPNADGYIVVGNYAYKWGTHRGSAYGWCDDGVTCGTCGSGYGDVGNSFDVIRYDYTNTTSVADGGGGAGGAGGSNPASGSGAGPGKQISGFEGNIIGVPALQPLGGYYAGGGGSYHPYGNAGGAGGGGSWPGTNNQNGNPGTTNSGGGGAGSYAYASGGDGGSGICVIRYPVSSVSHVITYRVHIFRSSDQFVASGINTVDVLVVAGGGAGGSVNVQTPRIDNGGGGGAGGFIEVLNHPISDGVYTVTVGEGGEANTAGPGGNGAPGGPSSFSSITATGGGGGGRNGSAGLPGGSGGGGGQDRNSGTSVGGSGNTPPVSPPQGNPGGGVAAPFPADNSTGGGGGAGGAGSVTYPNSPGRGGPGGEGRAVTWVPSSYGESGPQPGRYFAGGGGGGNWSPNYNFNTGGVGGGGNAMLPGMINTGGGGGGGQWGGGVPQNVLTGTPAGNGAPGIVAIRYVI